VTFNNGETAVDKQTCSDCSTGCPTNSFVSEACHTTSERVCTPNPVVGTSGTALFTTERGADTTPPAAVTVAPAATVTFPLSLKRATVVLSGGSSEDELQFDETGYAGPLTTSVAGNTLSFSAPFGFGSSSDYATAFKHVQFHSTDENVGGHQRSVNVAFKVWHTEAVSSSVASVTVNIAPKSNAPMISGAIAQIEYTQSGDPVPLASTMELTDVDSATLSILTVQIVNTYPGDTLDLVGASALIEAKFTSHTGTLVLSAKSGATPLLADFQTSVQSLHFSSVAQRPSTVPRQVSFIASDGAHSSLSRPLTIITVCAARGYFADVTLIPHARATLCPQGKYQPNTCQESCNSCSEGSRGAAPTTHSAPAITQALACTVCAAGHFQTAVAQKTCNACAAGKYGQQGTATNTPHHCKKCAKGTFQGTEGAAAQSGCAACGSGKYAAAEGTVECIPFACCPAGFARIEISPSAGGVCSPCMAGTFKVSGLQHCTDAHAQCEACATGRFGDNEQSTSAATYCTDCAVGKFQDAQGQHTGDGSQAGCKTCAAGTHQDTEGSASCKACVAGYYQAVVAQSTCVHCAKGKYGQPNVAQTSSSYCITCGRGKFNEKAGQHMEAACEHCPAGKRAAMVASTGLEAQHCVACEVGTFQNVVEFSLSCKECPVNQYQTERGKTECMPCDTNCAADQYVSAPCTKEANRMCSDRPLITGIGGVQQYAEGSPAVVLTSTANIVFGSTITSVKVALGAGAMPLDTLGSSDTAGKIVTQIEQGGKAVVLSGAKQISDYVAAMGQVTFVNTGHMKDQAARSVAASFTACHTVDICSPPQTLQVEVTPTADAPTVSPSQPVKTFTQNGPAITFAENILIKDKDSTNLVRATIKIGSSTLQTGDVLSCVGASPITASLMDGVCTLTGDAPVESYEAAIGALTFSTSSLSTVTRAISVYVADAKHVPSTSAPIISVNICAAAGFFGASNALALQECAAGKYSATTCANECSECAAGKFGTGDKGKTSAEHCVACQQGRFQTAAAATECTSCRAGHYGVAGAGATSEAIHCAACPAGTFAPGTGATSCAECDAGTHATTSTAAISCTSCTIGQYQDGKRQLGCKNCPAGRHGHENDFSTMAGACKECTTGSYTDAAGKGECDVWACCAAGSFVSGASTTTKGSCAACPIGTFQPGATCIKQKCDSWGPSCSDGYERLGLDATKTSACTACAAGWFRKQVTALPHAACTKCADGKISASGVSTCTECTRGQYTNDEQTTCTACGEDTYGHSGTSKMSVAHCKDCKPWGAWSMCSKSCGGGTQTRTRDSTPSTHHDDASSCNGAFATQTRACNSEECATNHCVYLKCRYRKNAAGHYALQVYHHRNEPQAVHHCKLFEGIPGTEPVCHCFCNGH
jgi:hypothetical protein